MKNYNPTFQQVALLAVLLSAVIIANVWAPAAVATITSIVSTIVGAVFVNLTPTVQGSDGESKPLDQKHIRDTGTFRPSGEMVSAKEIDQ